MASKPKKRAAGLKYGKVLSATAASQFLSELAITATSVFDRREVDPVQRSSIVRAVCKAAQRELSKSCGCKLSEDVITVRAGKGPSLDLVVLSVPPNLPKYPPGRRYWKTHRKTNESPPAFILRVYKTYLARGMTRQQLRDCDQTLAILFYKWVKEHGVPPELANCLLTRSERNALLASSFRSASSHSKRPASAALSRQAAALARRGL